MTGLHALVAIAEGTLLVVWLESADIRRREFATFSSSCSLAMAGCLRPEFTR
jgi:hypothetical protein